MGVTAGTPDHLKITAHCFVVRCKVVVVPDDVRGVPQDKQGRAQVEESHCKAFSTQ